MAWHSIVLLYIVASAVLAIYTRYVSLKMDRVFFTVGIYTYAVIALTGATASILYAGGLPTLPPQEALLYIVLEGCFIPLSWLMGYRLIQRIGAGNTAISTTVDIIAATALGAIFLSEHISPSFLLGGVFIIVAAFLSLTVNASATSATHTSLQEKILLIGGRALLIAVGIFFEKKAIDMIGSWDYMFYGWSMQFLMATIVYWFFGRNERHIVTRDIIQKSLSIGALTVLSGMLFVLALGAGALSSTITVGAGKIALTLILAALFLREYNSPAKRILAFVIMCIGLYFVMQAT